MVTDYSQMETKLAEMQLCRDGLRQAIGTPGEAAAKDKLWTAIKELNALMPKGPEREPADDMGGFVIWPKYKQHSNDIL